MNQARVPFVSICMPAYNVERTVRAALDSVLAQSYGNFEVILVDDGSSDATEAIVRSYTDERLRYVRNERNLGGYQTMNRAMSLAHGDYVAVYHTDDIYSPGIVEREVASLEAHPDAGAAFCLSRFMDQDGRIYGRMAMPEELAGKVVLAYEDAFPYLLRHKNILFCCPTFMARRSTIEAVGPFDAMRYDVAADLDMWIRILRRQPVCLVPEHLISYRHSKQQWSSRYNHLRVTQELYFDIMDRYLGADGWTERLEARDLTEYAFHRCDDDTRIAGNWVIRGDMDRAKAALAAPFPWRTFLTSVRRRKLRVLLMRAILSAGLAVGASRLLARLLVRTEYGGRV